MALIGPEYAGISRERDAAIHGIRQLKQAITDAAIDASAAYFEARMDLLEHYWHRFQSAQREMLMNYAHIEVIQDTHSEVEQTAATMYAEIKAELNQRKQAAAVPIHKLPRVSDIRLSKFSGQYTEWAAWRSEFDAKVMNTKLSPADKIGLLQSALIKEAAYCAGRVERLDELELKRVWDKLQETYDNKYQQVFAHISEILNIRPMTSPCAEHLRRMIDTVDQSLRMLKRFDIETQHWSPMVCVILLGKLDNETRRQWETKEPLPAMPELKVLIAHLNQRILAIRNVELSAAAPTQKQTQPTTGNPSGGKAHKSHHNEHKQRFHPYESSQRTTGAVTMQTAKDRFPEYPKCGNNVRHPLWQCESFIALSSAEQFELLKGWSLCEVCLVAKHTALECTKGQCPSCKSGRHNSLICPTKRKKVNHMRGGKRARRENKQE